MRIPIKTSRGRTALLLVLMTTGICALSVVEPARSDLPASSIGPASKDEAAILWKESKDLFDAGHFDEASERLQRYVDRYPGMEGYADAHWLLGLCFLRLRHPEKAIAPLRYFIGARGNTTAGVEAREDLARAYLDLAKYEEAELTANEILGIVAKPPQAKTPGLSTEALLLKAEALVGLGRETRARQSLDSAREEIRADATAPRSKMLSAWAQFVGLRLKTHECARFAGKSPVSEATAREQLDRYGSCLLESAILLHDAFLAGEPAVAKRAADIFVAAYRDYFAACSSPPPPTGKRTAAQKNEYRKELLHAFREQCSTNRGQAQDLIKTWQSSLPAPLKEELNGTSKSLAGLS